MNVMSIGPLMVVLAMVLTVLAGGSARQIDPPAADSMAVDWGRDPLVLRTELEAMLLEELTLQREVWRSREQSVHRVVVGTEYSASTAERILATHCHFDQFAIRNIGRNAPSGVTVRAVTDSGLHKIQSRRMRVAICPAWEPSDRPLEDIGEHTRALPSFSPRLVSLLDTAARRFPEQPFFLRQLVRALVDGDAAAAADTVLQRCTGGARCDALKGYVRYRLADWRGADSLFQRALASGPSAVVCGWNTISELQTSIADWRPFSRCAGNAVDSTGWWLAWPLWSEAENHRWLAHVARQVDWSLRTDLTRDLHWYLEPRLGGDAIQQLLIRYGSPSHIFNAGDHHDRDHGGYVRATVGKVYPGRPFAAPEYSRRNQSVLPAPTALVTPLSLTNDDFPFSRPVIGDERSWPPEFFQHPKGMLLLLAEPQRALLRRHHYALLVAGVRLPPTDTTLRAAPVAVTLLSQAPGGPRGVVDEQNRMAWGERAVLMGVVDRPTVLSLEALGNTPGVAGARYRWGAPVIPTWGRNDACALSDPLFLELPLATPSMESVRQRVRADVRFARGGATGLYFESYGFDRDTASIEVAVEDQTQRSTVSPLLQERLLSISYRDLRGRDAFLPVADDPSIQGRQLSLDLAALKPGDYLLRITMSARGCATVTSVRRFEVR